MMRTLTIFFRHLLFWVSLCLLIILVSSKSGNAAELRQVLGVWSVEGLLSALRDRNTKVQAKALDILFEIKYLSEIQEDFVSTINKVRPEVNKSDLITHISTLLEDPDKYVRWSAVTALGHFGGAAKAHVPDVVALLNDPDKYVRWSAVTTLGHFGDTAKAHVPEIAALLKDPDREGAFGDADAACKRS